MKWMIGGATRIFEHIQWKWALNDSTARGYLRCWTLNLPLFHFSMTAVTVGSVLSCDMYRVGV